jgi:cell division septation protein DedD
MKQEENADALAEILRQRNFPVFVFKRGPGPFYRVAIGVYGDADSAARVKDELERQSFKADLRHWVPE